MQDAPSKIPTKKVPPQNVKGPARKGWSPSLIPSRWGLSVSREWLRAIIACVLVAAIGTGGYLYWRYTVLYPSTDDAYVQANVVEIAPLVTGEVTDVNVHDYMHVKPDEVLLQIDKAPFEDALKAAQARLTLAEQQTKAGGPQAAAAKANADQAQAAVNGAKLQLEHATLKAPVDGLIGKVRIRPGAIARAGIGLFPLVETSHWWVDANFKETDLKRIVPGQPATVTLDLYPSRSFKGRVELVSPASGAAFSLLPPENASGNWVKVTQRFPVRVSIDNPSDGPPLRVGASASVTVDTTSGASDGASD